MGKHISLFLTLFFMSHAAFASSVNEDDDGGMPHAHAPAAQGPQSQPGATSGYKRSREEEVDQPSSKSAKIDDIQCYRVVCKEGNRILIPLFREVTNSQDLRSYLLNDDTKPTGKKFPQSGNMGNPTQNILCELSQLAREEILSYLDPRSQLNLMTVSQKFKRAAMAVAPLEDLTTPNSLRKALLIAGLGGQTGDLELFMKDQLETFMDFDISILLSMIDERRFNGVLRKPFFPWRNNYHSLRAHYPYCFLGFCRWNLNYTSSGLFLVPQPIHSWSCVYYVDLSYNNLAFIPTSFLDRLKQVEKLDLSHNQLIDLPEMINFHRLVRFDLSHNNLTTLQNLHTMPHLSYFSASHNHLKNLPLFLWGCVNLCELDLSYNQLAHITQLPPLDMLWDLDLSGNRLENLPNLRNLRTLRRLNVSFNRLRTLKGIETLSDLDFLNASCNQLEGFVMFPRKAQLEYLDVSQNRISSMGNIRRLKRLRTLNVSFNSRLELLDISSFRNLERIFLDHQQMKNPQFVSAVEALKSLQKTKQPNPNRMPLELCLDDPDEENDGDWALIDFLFPVL